MNLSWFISVQEIAFIDTFEGSEGVYLDGEKVAVSNSERGGYIRYAGDLDFNMIGKCDATYEVSTPLVFVGYAPNCTEDEVYAQVLKASGCNDQITSVTFDKGLIQESEFIKDLSNFTEVTLVRVEYTTEETKIYSPNCTYAVC